MIVDHADRLHEGVDDGRAAEFKAALRQFLGHRARDRGFGGHLAHGAIMVDLRLAVDEIPQQLGKAGAFFHDFEPGARREHRALDLGAIAHDAGVAHQPFDLGRPVARDFFRHKAVEGAAEIFALAQDGDPRQAGLETVEHEFFVERAVVVFRHAPFLIVIGDVERIVLGPWATHQGRIVRVQRSFGGPCRACGNFGFARKRKARPVRLDEPDRHAAGSKRVAVRQRLGRPGRAGRGRRHNRSPPSPRCRPGRAPAMIAAPACGAAPS